MNSFYGILLLFCLNGTCCLGQCDTLRDRQLFELFKTIYKTDQSNIKSPELREESFRSNFDTIITITKCQGFPEMSISASKRYKKKLRWGLLLTLYHCVQCCPDLYNDKNVGILKPELENGNIERILNDSWFFGWISNAINGEWVEPVKE